MADTLTTLIEKRHPSLGESAQLRERLATLADKLKLGIDEQDIKAFLLAEASKFLFFTQENSLLAGGETLFEELIKRAVNRTLVGVRILNIPKTEIKELRSLVKSIANEIGRTLDTSILQNTEINAARTAFVLIYERLLFWMRLIQDSIDLDFPIKTSTMLQTMQKFQTLLNTIHAMNNSDTFNDIRAHYYLESHREIFIQYYELLDKLEVSIFPRLRERTVPRNGRTPNQKNLELQGYDPPINSYEIEVTLKGIKPPIYRKLLIPGNRTLADLHLCIQDAFGWQDMHLHEFMFDHTRFGEASDDNDTVIIPDNLVSLDELSPTVNETIQYTYDFGDNWEHRIKITARESLSEAESWQVPCYCIECQRAGPPEDCGGIYGYRELQRSFTTPRTKRTTEQLEFLEWAGNWNPEKCNIQAINKKLARR